MMARGMYSWQCVNFCFMLRFITVFFFSHFLNFFKFFHFVSQLFLKLSHISFCLPPVWQQFYYHFLKLKIIVLFVYHSLSVSLLFSTFSHNIFSFLFLYFFKKMFPRFHFFKLKTFLPSFWFSFQVFNVNLIYFSIVRCIFLLFCPLDPVLPYHERNKNLYKLRSSNTSKQSHLCSGMWRWWRAPPPAPATPRNPAPARLKIQNDPADDEENFHTLSCFDPERVVSLPLHKAFLLWGLFRCLGC